MKAYQKPIHELHSQRMSGETTTEEITRKLIQRIKNVEEKVHAFLHLQTDKALEKAIQADQWIKEGKEIHPLTGMPLAVKDIFVTKGIPTTCASRFLEDFMPPYESTATTKLEALDYNLIGKTNLDEFAMGSSTENSGFGVTRNPWDLERVPGGSSGGSAAAVASGMALAALGTDTGGSIRQPASFTGIVGLKPSYGRVSRFGMVAYASSLDQGGPMTQDVEDSAIILNAISGYDDKDSTSMKTKVPDFTEFLNKDVKGMKIGVLKELDLDNCDQDVQRVFQENLETLKKGGAEIIEVNLPNLEHAIATYYVIAPAEASSNLGRYDGIRYGLRSKEAKRLQEVYEQSREQGFGDEVKLRILLGTFTLSSGYYDAYYLKAQKIQNLIRKQFQQAFSQVDLIATPVAPTPAFKLGEKKDDPLQMYLSDAFTVPANLAGIPGISVPGGFSAGNLPIGLQLLADHQQEGKLIQASDWFEKELQLAFPELAI